jgi:dCMP deaminase
MTRPTWNRYFMQIAHAVAERSTCDRAHVGCVLVRDKRILTTGYNGSACGLGHCDDIGHLLIDGHCVRTVHAEINAIIQAARHGVSTEGASAVITHFPCLNCAKALINAGIVRIVYANDYRRIAHAATFLKEAGILVERMQ